MQDVSLGSVSRALRERSEEFLTRSCMRLFKGKDTLEPDVILKLGDVMLPAHRALLAKSSNYFNELFQVSSASQRLLLYFRVQIWIGPSYYR